MSHRINKNNNKCFPTKVFRVLCQLLILFLIILIACMCLKKIAHYNTFNLLIKQIHFFKKVSLSSIATIVILFLIVCVILIFRKLYTHITKNPYGYLSCYQLDNWLYDVGLYLMHGDYIILPKVKRYKQSNALGIEIEILGDLREKMLNINSSLSSYIASKGSDWYVSESYESKGGYIRYIFLRGIETEQLGGDDIEL